VLLARYVRRARPAKDAPATKDERAAWKLVQRFCVDKSEQQCRAIVRTWEDNGLLYVKKYDDSVQRKLRDGLYVDNTKRPPRPAGRQAGQPNP